MAEREINHLAYWWVRSRDFKFYTLPPSLSLSLSFASSLREANLTHKLTTHLLFLPSSSPFQPSSTKSFLMHTPIMLFLSLFLFYHPHCLESRRFKLFFARVFWTSNRESPIFAVFAEECRFIHSLPHLFGRTPYHSSYTHYYFQNLKICQSDNIEGKCQDLKIWYTWPAWSTVVGLSPVWCSFAYQKRSNENVKKRKKSKLFSHQSTIKCQIKNRMYLLGFELRISSIKCDHATNFVVPRHCSLKRF